MAERETPGAAAAEVRAQLSGPRSSSTLATAESPAIAAVLIVEDDSMVSLIIELALAAQDHSVATARNGKESRER